MADAAGFFVFFKLEQSKVVRFVELGHLGGYGNSVMHVANENTR